LAGNVGEPEIMVRSGLLG